MISLVVLSALVAQADVDMRTSRSGGTSAGALVSVDGSVVDALAVRKGGADRIWLSVTRAGKRVLVSLDPKTRALADVADVAPGAVFVDACPTAARADDVVVLADARGLTDETGARLVEGTTLFVVPDPNALLAGDLCGKAGEARGELYVPVVDGLLVSSSAGKRTLVMRHAARAYSGRAGKGLRPDRGYAEALSLYGPRLVSGDVDGDGDVDLVAEKDGRVLVYKRDNGALAAAPSADVDLAKKVGAGDADLRVRFVDVDMDKRLDALVGVTRGAIPETSQAWTVFSTDAPFSRAAQLWSRDGLSAPLDVQKKRGLVVAEVDTSLVSLSAVVITGRLPLRVSLLDTSGGSTRGDALETQAKIDVRRGQMEGALPVVSIDFDGDGTADLLDLGEPGEAKLHKGTATGFSTDVERSWTVPRSAQVVPMPSLPGVVLIGEPSKGKTRVAVLVR